MNPIVGQVAVSLVCHAGSFNATAAMLNSLSKSDFDISQSKLFAHLNCGELDPEDARDDHWQGSSENRGIVEPRIELMQKILEDERFKWCLEIHSDMMFPSQWWQQLLTVVGEDVGIAMPWIIGKVWMSPNACNDICPKLVVDRVDDNPLQVHPWLLNLEAIRQVGYYDPQFAPARCEDDDLVLRIRNAGWRTVATRRSVVNHMGNADRGGLLGLNENSAKFEQKHQMTVDDFYRSCSVFPSISAFEIESMLAPFRDRSDK